MIINEYGEGMDSIIIYLFVCQSRKGGGGVVPFAPPPLVCVPGSNYAPMRAYNLRFHAGVNLPGQTRSTFKAPNFGRGIT